MRLVSHLSESSYRLETNTTKGFSRYDEMEENNLFIEKSGARRWHNNKSLVTTTYVYDGDKLVGWSGIKYLQTPTSSKNYGKVTAGIVGVFTNPEYRGKGVAKLAMTELKRHLPTEKSPLTTFIKKYKKPYDRWNIEIRHEKRITGLVKNVFDDLNVWDEPIYEIVTL